jgi:hypothetical protein
VLARFGDPQSQSDVHLRVDLRLDIGSDLVRLSRKKLAV